MTHHYNPLIKNLQHVTGITSDSIRDHYNVYVRRYPQDNEGFGMMLHVMNHPEDKTARFMLIRHIKELHHLED